MTHDELKKELRKIRRINPISLNKMSLMIGIDQKTLECFMHKEDYYPSELTVLKIETYLDRTLGDDWRNDGD